MTVFCLSVFGGSASGSFFENGGKIAGICEIQTLTDLSHIERTVFQKKTGSFKLLFCDVVFPLLKPTVITMLILSVGRIFASDFGLFYQIPKNSGALYNVTQTIDVYVYNALMKNADYGMSSAASVFQSIVGFLFVVVANALVRKYSEENALF